MSGTFGDAEDLRRKQAEWERQQAAALSTRLHRESLHAAGWLGLQRAVDWWMSEASPRRWARLRWEFVWDGGQHGGWVWGWPVDEYVFLTVGGVLLARRNLGDNYLELPTVGYYPVSSVLSMQGSAEGRWMSSLDPLYLAGSWGLRLTGTDAERFGASVEMALKAKLTAQTPSPPGMQPESSARNPDQVPRAQPWGPLRESDFRTNYEPLEGKTTRWPIWWALFGPVAAAVFDSVVFPDLETPGRSWVLWGLILLSPIVIYLLSRVGLPLRQPVGIPDSVPWPRPRMEARSRLVVVTRNYVDWCKKCDEEWSRPGNYCKRNHSAQAGNYVRLELSPTLTVRQLGVNPRLWKLGGLEGPTLVNVIGPTEIVGERALILSDPPGQPSSP